jgi:hypothetical protein
MVAPPVNDDYGATMDYLVRVANRLNSPEDVPPSRQRARMGGHASACGILELPRRRAPDCDLILQATVA